MINENKPLDKIIDDLKERAKELNCLYEIQEILNNFDASVDDISKRIIKAIPPGWQYPDVCQVSIEIKDSKYQSAGFIETLWSQCAGINVRDENVGKICVSYKEERPADDEGPFLKEERQLIDAVSNRIAKAAERISTQKQLQVERQALQDANAALHDSLVQSQKEKKN